MVNGLSARQGGARTQNMHCPPAAQLVQSHGSYREAVPSCAAFRHTLTAVTVSLMKFEPEEKPANTVGVAASGAQDCT